MLKPSVKHLMIFAFFSTLEVPFLFFLYDLRMTQLIHTLSILHASNLPLISHTLVRKAILMLSEIVNLSIHFELMFFEDVIIIVE